MRKIITHSYYRRLLILIIATSSFAVQNISLTFYDSVVVNDAKITLSDVARISGSCGENTIKELEQFVVGDAAPAGYSRYMNTSDVLTYILAPDFRDICFNVEKQVRVKIRTDSKVHHVHEYEKQIQEYIAENTGWEKGCYSVSIGNLERQWQSYNKPCKIAVKGLESPFPKGSVQLALVVTQDKSEVTIPIQCKISVTVPVVCVTERLERNSKIERSSIQLISKDITGFRYTPYTDFASVIGALAMRTMTPGTILHKQCIKPVPDVCKSDNVLIVMEKGPVRVSVPARAREEGVKGEMIWVENLQTHKILRVKIVEKGCVQLMEGENI